MKYLIILIILAAVAYVGMNFDFANFKPNTTNTIKQEKTIMKVKQGRERRNQEINDALNF